MPQLPLDSDATYTQRVFLLSDDSNTHGDGWHTGVLCDSIRGGYEGAAKDYITRAELPPGDYTLGCLAGNDLKLVSVTVEPPVEPQIIVKRILSI